MLPEYSDWWDLGPQSASGNPIQPNGQDPASTNQPATKPPGDPDEGGGGSDTFTMTDLARQLMMNKGPKDLHALKNPITGALQSTNLGGWNARDLERWIRSFEPGSPERDAAQRFAQDALIQKDYWIHQANQAREGRGPGLGGNVRWQQANAKNPEWGGSDVDWQKWFEFANQAWPSGYGADQSTLNWNPAAMPAQYRQGAENWFRQQGLNPTGSLGQYGYTRYQRAQGQPYRPISLEALNAIPDRQLRDWMLYLGSLGGLIPGSYQRPQV